MAAQRPLEPLVKVRILLRQPGVTAVVIDVDEGFERILR